MVNKRLLIIGAIVALFFGGVIFVLSFMNAAAPPVEILAARQDISEGTLVGDIPDEAFARIPLTGDDILLSSYLTEIVWQQIKLAGGIVISDVYQYEAIPLSAIASSANPKAMDIPRLGLTDPNLVVVSLKNVSVPNGIKAGDYVDLIVAVESAQEQVFTLVQTQNIETLMEAMAETELAEGEVAPPTPTPIVIPRQAQEFVLMADTAGNLAASMLSPMVDAETDGGPTLGAHFEDLLDLFTADRNALEESE
jgi:hypothetical protein